MLPLRWAIAALLLPPVAALAQEKGKTPEPPITITLTTEPKWERRLAAAQDYIAEKDWQRATMILQSVLDAPDEAFVRVKRTGKDGKEITKRTTARAEAERMIRALPAEGIAYYRAAYKEAAAGLQKKAKDGDRKQNLEELARRFLYTDAGGEALEALAVAEFHAGHPQLAWRLGEQPPAILEKEPDPVYLMRSARGFDRLLDLRGGPDALSQPLLFKAALAFRAAGDPAKSERMWRTLQAKVAKEGFLANKHLKLEQLRQEIDGIATRPMFGGISSWSLQQGKGDVPYLRRQWEQPLFYEDSKGQAQDWIKKAQEMLSERGQALLPALHPIAAKANIPGKGARQLMIYRSHWGIHAVDINAGLLMWDADMKWSLEQMYKEPRTIQAIDNWKQGYQLIGRPNIVLENSVIGSLTSDGRLVYAVDDLPVPPVLGHLLKPPQGNPPLPWGREVNDAAYHNVLHAYELSSGKMLWVLGGPGGKPNPRDPKKELNDSYFLGPPLPLGGRLYAVTEKAKELRLAILDPRRGTVDRVVPLAKLRDSMLEDIWRRTHAAHPAYGEGVLLCPTNAGAIIGVDAIALAPKWAYLYRHDKEPPILDRERPEDFAASGGLDGWRNTGSIVVDGKVVFTAPDSAPIHCLKVKDGSHIWKAEKKPDDLYLAGVLGDKVLIVGKENCRALSITHGEQVWMIRTGLPSGRGIASDGRYYLPLKIGAETKLPEVCVIDIAKGQIVAHAKAREGQNGNTEAPGDLLFFDGKLLSQTATKIAGYPLLAMKLKEVDEALQRNPRDSIALIERARMRLDRGELSKAVEDLRIALAIGPPDAFREQARQQLFEALSALLLKDFNAREKDLKEYEELCTVERPKTEKGETERRRRRGIYLMVVARGYEQQGKLLEAVRAYQAIAEKANPNDLMPAPDDPGVKVAPDRWAIGQIEGLLKRATPAQRKQLEEELEKRRK
jgi:tetratricopeptide (TPR) repeat protein